MLPAFVLENFPVFDIISDVYLLATEWPKTATNAPSDLEECSTWRSLWYVALAFTIVGTLVDLVPEALLLTEFIIHPRILKDGSAFCKVLNLLISDGKPIISFAASQDDVGETLEVVRTSLRNRCQLYHEYRFQKADESYTAGHRMFAGIQGSLAAGEILTAVGAGLFLSIEFSWPAFASIVWSLFAFLASTRKNMMAVQLFEGDLSSVVDEVDTPSYLGTAMPGPVTFLKFVLAIPFWPISLNLWGIFRNSPSDEHIWVWPPSWLGVSGFSSSRALDWYLFPHYICNWIAAPFVLVLLSMWIGHLVAILLLLPFVFVVEVVLLGKLWRWYFGRHEGVNSCMYWTRKLASTLGGAVFRPDRENLIGALECLGSALSMAVAIYGNAMHVALFFLVQAAVLGVAILFGNCAEQEWALASAHLGWCLVLLCAKSCHWINPFVTPLQIGCENDDGIPETGEIDRSTVSDYGDSTSKSTTVVCAQ